MGAIKFKKGYLSVDINKERGLAMFLSFNKCNEGSEEYLSVLNSLPKIRGLKRGSNRMNFAFDLVNNIHKSGYSVKKDDKRDGH